jgi:ArsR family transcriptional regulator, arsenate/arsenite/antimonite-responsive transcriptional repressor
LTELINILKALSDDTRYRLVNLLLRHDLCVGALATRLNITESAVSQHLKVLRSAGIVRGDKRGYYTHYYVDREMLRQAANKMIKLSRFIPLDNKCQKDCVSVNKHHSKKGVKQHDA